MGRIKNAIKCLLGKDIQKVTSHKYILNIDDKQRLEGYTVIVTGGTGAIGSAICYKLASMGATVGVAARDINKLNNMITLIKENNPDISEKLVPIVLDVNNDQQIEKVIYEFKEKYGKVDVFINNAGGQPGRVGVLNEYLFEQEVNQIDLMLNTNLRGTIICSRCVSKIMSNQRNGHIINMSSVIGLGGKRGYSDYAASKAGVIGFTKSLALELAKFNVRVNCVSPGIVNQVPFDGGSPKRNTRMNPLHRAGYTDEVADSVVFLITNNYITGQNIIIDGGRILGLYGDD